MRDGPGRYRKIFTSIWVHPEFLAFTDFERVVLFYLLTGPQTNRIGLYKLSIAQAAEDLKASPIRFRKGLDRVSVTLSWLYDHDARVLFIPTWWRWNPPSNANHAYGNMKDLAELPPCALIEAFARNIETLPEGYREPFTQGLLEYSPRAFSNQEQEQEQKLKQKQKLAALRAEDGNERSDVESNDGARSPRQAQIEGLAKDALSFAPKHAELDELLDTFYQVAKSKGVSDCPRSDALSAITAALAARRSA